MGEAARTRAVERMVTRTYRVRFVTPGFVGGAEQSGQWRRPPWAGPALPSGELTQAPICCHSGTKI